MKMDHRLGSSTDGANVRALALRADELGLATLWSSEAGHDPFLSLGPASDVSERVMLGTAIAIMYARSPFASAQAAWDLQRASGGRFVLGLGTQIRPHVERRYGVPWHGALGPMREYVGAMRAIWACWQDARVPDFRGDHYQFTLSNPEFEPPPLPEGHAHIPVWIAAVGPRMAELAGEVADGAHIHAFHTPRYLQDVLVPALLRGARRGGGLASTVPSTCPVFAGVAHDERQRDALRVHFAKALGFYASTPAYQPVLEHTGWREVHTQARALVREGRWRELPQVVPTKMLDEFVVVDDARSLGAQLAERYSGLLTQLGLYRGGDQFMDADDWRSLVDAIER